MLEWCEPHPFFNYFWETTVTSTTFRHIIEPLVVPSHVRSARPHYLNEHFTDPDMTPEVFSTCICGTDMGHDQWSAAETNNAVMRHMLNGVLPVFVYGTLRHGEGNYRRNLQGATVREQEAMLPDATMRAAGCPFVTAHNPLPVTPANTARTHSRFAAAEGNPSVTGEVMWINAADYEDTMADLDTLEGYTGPDGAHNLYNRRMAWVRLTGQSNLLDGTPIAGAGQIIPVWTYLVDAGDSYVDKMGVVADGNWLNYRSLNRTRYSR